MPIPEIVGEITLPKDTRCCAKIAEISRAVSRLIRLVSRVFVVSGNWLSTRLVTAPAWPVTVRELGRSAGLIDVVA